MQESQSARELALKHRGTQQTLQKSALSRKRVIIQSSTKHKHGGTLSRRHMEDLNRDRDQRHFQSWRCIKSGSLARSLAPDTVEIQMSSQMCCLWLFDSQRVGSLSFNDVKRERERVGQKLNKRKNLCACMLQRDEVNIWEAQHAQPHRYEVLLFFRHRQKSRMCVWISQGVVACFCFSVSFLCTQMMMSNLVPGACFCNEWDHQF